jgi:hypothetical protein
MSVVNRLWMRLEAIRGGSLGFKIIHLAMNYLKAYIH